MTAKNRGESFLRSLQESRIVDPLSDGTKKERGLLLGASLATFAVTLGGLIPKEISALGIEISDPEQASLMLVLSVVLAYLVMTFFIYALADYSAWRVAKQIYQDAVRKGISDLIIPAKTGSELDLAATLQGALTHSAESFEEDALTGRHLVFISKARIVFDTLVPLVAGTYALDLSVHQFASISELSNTGLASILFNPWPFIVVSTVLGSAFLAVLLMRRRLERPLRDKRESVRRRTEAIQKETAKLTSLNSLLSELMLAHNKGDSKTVEATKKALDEFMNRNMKETTKKED